MSSRVEGIPEEPVDGDGIKVTFEPQEGGTTVATICDTVRSRTLSKRVPTRYVEQKPDLLRRFLILKLTEALNREPMQVGCFPNGKNGKSGGSGTMPK